CTGLLVANRDESFVAAIRRLAEDEALRRRLAANARAHVSENFSLQVAVNRWENFCADLLAEADARTGVPMPRRLDLPPPLPAFGTQDSRRWQVALRRSIRALRRAGRWLTGSTKPAPGTGREN